MLGFKGDIEYLYNISPLVVSTMQFFRTILILIDFEMKQATDTNYVVGLQGCQIDT